MNLRVKSILLLMACLVISPCLAKLADYSKLALLDFPLEYCDVPIRLDVADNTFREIENQLPGKPLYNQLIRSYSRKKWDELTEGFVKFRAQYESSPLIEAVEFLDYQSQLEQSSLDGESLKKLENRFRELLVLYPRSTLIPTIQGSLANTYLKSGAYSKALGLYQVALQEYPFHASTCVHQLGVAEANYLLGSYEDAQLAFKLVLQKCQANRLQVASRVRLIDIARAQGEVATVLTKKYETVNNENPTVISRYHPEVLFNLGEYQYRNKNYQSASFYFNDFQRSLTGVHTCQPRLQKRQADLSVHRNENQKQIVGNYLSVYEKFPKDDLAKFCRIHGLLIEYPEMEPAESERRKDIVLSMLSEMKNNQTRAFGEIELSLAMLEKGEMSAIDPLSDQKNKIAESDSKNQWLAFVRKILLSQTQLASNLQVLEKTYANWFQGTTDEEAVKSKFKEVITSEYIEALEMNRPKKALSKIDYFKQSPLFEPRMLDSKERKRLVSLFLEKWIVSESAHQKKYSDAVTSYQSELKNVLQEDYVPLLIRLQLERGDDKELQKLIASLLPVRPIASKTKQNEMMPSAYAFVMGSALRQLRKFPESQKYLLRVTATDLQPQKNRELLQVFASLGKSEKGLEMGFQWLAKGQEKQPKEFLNIMREVLITGKAWKRTPQLVTEAQKLKLTETEMLPYQSLNARSLMEQGALSKAEAAYERVLEISPEGTESTENNFNLARVLLRLKNIDGAKKRLQVVVDRNDEFWSPLAKNELKMLESP